MHFCAVSVQHNVQTCLYNRKIDNIWIEQCKKEILTSFPRVTYVRIINVVIRDSFGYVTRKNAKGTPKTQKFQDSDQPVHLRKLIGITSSSCHRRFLCNQRLCKQRSIWPDYTDAGCTLIRQVLSNHGVDEERQQCFGKLSERRVTVFKDEIAKKLSWMHSMLQKSGKEFWITVVGNYHNEKTRISFVKNEKSK